MASKTKEVVPRLPRWLTEGIAVPFKSGTGLEFILHGDINGLFPNPDTDEEDKPYLTLRQLLEEIFRERELVMIYNIASGLRFLTPEMEKVFRKVAELDTADKDSTDPVAAAKAGLQAKRSIPKEPENCLPLIEKALKKVEGAAVVIQSAHFIAPASGGGVSLPPSERANIERLRNWANHDRIRELGNMVILLTDQAAKISSELRANDGGVQTVFIPKPTLPERLRFLTAITKNKTYPLPPDWDVQAFAVATQGMNLRQIMDIFLQAAKTSKKIDLDYVKAKKKEILNAEYGDIMEVVEPVRGMDDIGGLAYIKAYLLQVLEAIKSGEERLVPMGVTLMGPPGTGKTAIVEALAYEARFNFVRTKNIRSMWVGESEARMEKLVNGLRSLAPVVVMNDEADLNEADRNAPKGDSGVSERIMKMWMELLSDPRIRGKIIVISCTNRPDRIDPAMKRSGRSDERILVPMPSAVEREAIFRVMLKRHGIPAAIADFNTYAEKTDGLSGADIENIVLHAWRFAFEKGKKEVDDEVLDEAISDFIPSASQAEIDRMTMMGILECSSRRLLPPNIGEIVEKVAKRNLLERMDDLLAQLEARKIIPT